jgi:hypothetical protein
MTECDRIRADAPGLAALRPDDPERAAAAAHARGCPGCERALREAERLQALLAAVEPEPVPAGALERASREIRAQLRRETRRRLAGSAVAICASVAVFVAFARQRSPASADWAIAAVLWALALAFGAAASRRPALVAAGAVVAAIAAAAASGAGPLAPSTGLECLATELASAAAVVGAVWFAIRGGSTSPSRIAIAAAGAAGALAGDAALQLTCAAHGSAPHLLAFHVAGVILAAAAASALWRPPLRAAA